MFGLPIPEDLDGRVLKEIFKKDSKPTCKEGHNLPEGRRKKRIGERIRTFKVLDRM